MTGYKIIGILSAVIFASGYIPYIISILKGNSRPHPVSWVLWAVIGAVTFYFSILVGAKETLPLALLNFLMPCTVAVLSLKYWKGGFSLFDYSCLALSFGAIVVYIFFHSAVFSLSLNLLADILAYLPTLRKTFRDPASEDFFTWLLFVVGYSLSIVAAIPHFTYGIAVFPIYLTAFGLCMLALILRKRTVQSHN